MKNKKFIILFILFIGIGFAYISTNLNVISSALFKKGEYNVYIDKDNITIERNDIDALITSDYYDKTYLCFKGYFEYPGDALIYTFDIVNDSDIDIIVEKVDYVLPSTYSDYIDYTVTYADSSEIVKDTLLRAHSRVKLRVVAKAKESLDTIPEMHSIDFKYDLDYRSATREETLNESYDFSYYSGLIQENDHIDFPCCTSNAYTKIYGSTLVRDNQKNLLSLPTFHNEWDGSTVWEDNNSINLEPNEANGSSTLFWSAIQYLYLPKGHTYTFSRYYVSGGENFYSGNMRTPLILYYADGTKSDEIIMSDVTPARLKNTYSVTFTTEKDVTSIQIDGFTYNINGLDDTLTYNFQLEEGSTSTSFVEHQRIGYNNPQNIESFSGIINVTSELDNYSIDLSNYELNAMRRYEFVDPHGSYTKFMKDYIYTRNNKLYLHKEIGKLRITGEEQIKISVYDDITRVKIYNLLDKSKDGYNDIFLSNRFTWTRNDDYIIDTFYFEPEDNNLYIYIDKSAGTSTEDIRNYFRNNEVIFYYDYLYPKEIELHDSDLYNKINMLGNNQYNKISSIKPSYYSFDLNTYICS